MAGFCISAQAKEFPAVPGEYIVKLKPQTQPMSKSGIEQALGAKFVRKVNNVSGLIKVQRSVVETADSSIRALSASPLVEYAEPNYIYRVVGGMSSLPNDTDLGKLWGLVNTGQVVTGDSGTFTGKAGIDINAREAWKIETGSRDILVAVVDTGVKWDHPDLAANIYTNQAEANGQPGVDDDHNGFVDDIHGYDFPGNDGDPMDVYGHGTHVTGTIAALGNNNNGIVGVAFNVKILPVRFLGDDGGGTLEDAVKSIDYATMMHANMMNNSWGGGGFSQALLESIQRAQAAGILFLAAAGNNSNDNDASPEYPAGYEVDNVVAVAAIDPTGMIADFSNYGKNTVDIAAPGVNILSYTMQGPQIWSGTSMATPHVTGVAALLLSQDKSQSYMTIKNRLLASARPIGALRNRVSTGLVNAYYALTNQVAPDDPDDPYNWQKDVATESTPHPYVNGHTQSHTFHVPGAHRVSVWFSKFETEPGYDKVVFKDSTGAVVGSMSGRLGDVFGPPVNGDTVTIEFTSDDTVTSYGFDVGGVAYQ
jgi:subtilisin family serine protease